MPHYNIGLTIELDRWHDTRRRVEPPWRSWCKSPTWKSIRRHRLAEEPRCRQCAIEGRIVAASHVDHVEPHLGQWLLFFKYENTQSLCAQHHHRHNHPEKRGNSTNKPTDRLVGARSAIRRTAEQIFQEPTSSLLALNLCVGKLGGRAIGEHRGRLARFSAFPLWIKLI